MSTDRLMADVERLAVACAWWQLSCETRPLIPESLTEAEAREEEWSQDRDVEYDRATAVLRRVRDQKAALATLAAAGNRGQKARRHAAHAVRRALGDWAPRHVHVHVFGEGWRDVRATSIFVDRGR